MLGEGHFIFTVCSSITDIQEKFIYTVSLPGNFVNEPCECASSKHTKKLKTIYDA
jgi:hypothetical protein